MKRILIACEYSGTVRDAFAAKGWDAWSCDILPSDKRGNHIQDDVLNVIKSSHWDMMIAHPPCTNLAVSGAAWFAKKRADGSQQKSIDFFMALANAPIEKIAVENPVCIMSTEWRKPDQIVHPWMFGHMEQKATCLWLKGLPKLTPSNDVKSNMMELPKNQRERIHYLPPSADRWKIRSKTFPGIAEAMANQWGGF
jgi:hypothetical protein